MASTDEESYILCRLRSSGVHGLLLTTLASLSDGRNHHPFQTNPLLISVLVHYIISGINAKIGHKIRSKAQTRRELYGVLKGVIPSKRISYPYTPLEIKVAKRRRKDILKALSSIEKRKIAMPLSLSYIVVQCARAIGEQHELKKEDVTLEATIEEHNIIVDNPSNVSKEEEKIEHASSGERKNYPFKGFNISDEAPKKLTQLINNYTEWIADGLLKHHAGRDCGLFVAAYVEYLNDGLQVPNDELDVRLLRKRYASLLRKYGEAKAQKPYGSDIKDPR
ncbi:hypothetical protein BC332_07384 [Capsicum chinense]|nr:hypothetical protein BC332_07384 [Capsicum chinense]